MTSYFNNESLDFLSKEYRSMPTDENGNAYEPEYNGVTVRRDVMRLIFDLRSSMAALEEAQQQLWTAKEERDSQQRVCIKVMEELTEAQQQLTKREEMLEESLNINSRLENRYIEAQQTIARQQEALDGIRRIIQSAESYTTLDLIKSVMVSAEWACMDALMEGDTQS